ncbi:hypothetical protein GPZ77_34205 (plasmid) [Streptomyces sp. QHH-9511]|uniref:hypothetical protein n=1 Tax=Streptomyces sp. QHH-9511 TaxID=2684468 RepID=UPI001316E251|nr:hypothetical protein [Streptomyces sp. QHH-9511]QGZ53405.1 hypothetical protein GPZ77_34205 [Streptomyces sp. QHH-9511]
MTVPPKAVSTRTTPHFRPQELRTSAAETREPLVAISTIQPYTPTQDLVTYKEAKRLFARTGHGVSERTMRGG